MRLIVFSLTLVLITIEKAESISRADFPKGFIFGIASSAHQVCISGFLLLFSS